MFEKDGLKFWKTSRKTFSLVLDLAGESISFLKDKPQFILFFKFLLSFRIVIP